MHRFHLVVIGLILALMFSAVGHAREWLEVTWDDLVPADSEFDDPFTRLDEEQLYNLTLVAQIRDRLDNEWVADEDTMSAYSERVEQLEEQGIDIDVLLGMREQVAAERLEKSMIANEQLDGERIRIPGYVLPLEYDDDLVTEFLLVPYVGACIHVPPPPPNQIVHVVAKDGVETDGGLFTPVWVYGLMKTEQSESSLTLVDGSSNVPTSYRLFAESVEMYQ